MILSSALKYAYNKLYIQLRKYLWDMDVVEQIADLEIEVYKAVPSLDTLKLRFTTLYNNIRMTAREDEELSKTIDFFRNMIENADAVCAALDKVREEIQV